MRVTSIFLTTSAIPSSQLFFKSPFVRVPELIIFQTLRFIRLLNLSAFCQSGQNIKNQKVR